jgi:hypothetical protein
MADEEIKQDQQENPATVVETNTPDTTPETTVEETTPTQPTKEEPVEEFDLEEITNKASEAAAQKAQEAVLGKIASALGLSPEEADKAKDEGLVPPWEKRGEDRPKSWKEQAEYSADLAVWKQDQAKKAAEEAEAKAKDEEKQKTESWNKHWDEQLDDLVATGKLAKVENKDDPNDRGVVERKALWQKMYDVNQQRLAEGKQAISSLKEIYYEHYQDPNAQPAGADAPVSLGRNGGTSGNATDYSYDDIHKASFEQIIGNK